ncbi:hypothetical protein [Planctobacterium marinum]|uniref:hypothetical protein n=1 Tax=Planctobacterium marinum TaxID=1631968 RepID=UPI001E2D29EA|nr:hypothetical protein [Planctobacterium marinum]MCC2604096.1 hypothetical protein [Planctobacterium marinum]
MPSHCAEYYVTGRHFKVSETQTVADCTTYYAITYSEMQPLELHLTIPSYISCNQIHSSGTFFTFARIDYNSFSECTAANEFIILQVATYNDLLNYQAEQPQTTETDTQIAAALYELGVDSTIMMWTIGAGIGLIIGVIKRLEHRP